jgi:hypothetical protein
VAVSKYLLRRRGVGNDRVKHVMWALRKLAFDNLNAHIK